MKNPARVAELLAELRELADNDFERHRIDVLERDLTAPPVVEVIDATHQRFNGVVYTKDRTGHYRATYHIHRVAWCYYNGEIPYRHEIHHADTNPSNNAIDNLRCLTKSEHQKLHKPKGEPAAHRTWNTESICPQCGKTFYNSQSHRIYCSEECRLENEYITKQCPVCGKIFRVHKKHHHQVFCSRHCFMKDRCAKK